MNIIINNNLKQCPFCGHTAHIIDMGCNRYQVKCENCSAKIGATWGTDETIERLVELWNVREKDVTVNV